MLETGKKFTKLLQDEDVWQIAHPDDLWVYDKLIVAKKQQLKCGPAGVNIPETNNYIIRPITNMVGMSLGAKIMKLAAGDKTTVPTGHFFVQQLEGPQYSVTYENCSPLSTYEAHRDPTSPLWKFDKWVKVDNMKDFPTKLLGSLKYQYSHINVEWIGDYIIEVHLRGSPDPDYDELIPVWSSDVQTSKPGYEFIVNYEDGDGLLPDPRLGFFVRSKKQ